MKLLKENTLYVVQLLRVSDQVSIYRNYSTIGHLIVGSPEPQAHWVIL